MAAESFFLSHLFNALNTSGIRYAVIRNYASLPDTVAGSDLDILVAPEDEKAIRKIIFDSIEHLKGVTIGFVERYGFFKINAFGCINKVEKKWWGVSIDAYRKYLYKSCPIINLGYSFRFSVKHNGIIVLETGFSAVLSVLKEVMHNSQVPKKHHLAAAKAAQQDWERISLALTPIGRQGLEILRKIILIDTSEADIVKQARNLRRVFFAQAIRRSPMAFICNRFLYELSKVKRCLSPSGIIIAVLGTDGAGKSTVIDAIKPVLESATHNTMEVRHLRPGLLPSLARLKGKQAMRAGPVLDPHGLPPSGVFGSLFRLIYLTIDYVLGYWLLLRPKIVKNPNVVLFDRYAYDIALDSLRFRIDLPAWAVRLFARLAPRPDLVICLYADSGTIVSRKRELPLEEICRQVEALKEFAKIQPNAVLISTEESIEEVRERVLNVLYDFFLKRKKHG